MRTKVVHQLEGLFMGIVASLFIGLLSGCGASGAEGERARLATSEIFPTLLATPIAVTMTATPTTIPPVTLTAPSSPTPLSTPPETPARVEAVPPSPTSIETSAVSATPTPAVAAAATVQPEIQPSPPLLSNPAPAEDLVEYGIQVYRQQYCGICHKLDVANTAGLFGPDQSHIGTIAEQRIQDPNYTGTATTAAEYIRESLLNPGIYLVEGYEQSRHHMPAFTHLAETEIKALVQMLLQQK